MSQDMPQNQPTNQPVLSNDLREIKFCVPFFFSQEGSETAICWSWRSKFSFLKAQASPNLARGTVQVSVVDTLTGMTIKRWSSKVNIMGDSWRFRLRQAVGVAFLLAQHRHKCPLCHAETTLFVTGSNNEQAFRCSEYPACNGLINIVDYDIERKEAVNTGLRTVASAIGSGATVTS